MDIQRFKKDYEGQLENYGLVSIPTELGQWMDNNIARSEDKLESFSNVTNNGLELHSILSRAGFSSRLLRVCYQKWLDAELEIENVKNYLKSRYDTVNVAVYNQLLQIRLSVVETENIATEYLKHEQLLIDAISNIDVIIILRTYLCEANDYISCVGDTPMALLTMMLEYGVNFTPQELKDWFTDKEIRRNKRLELICNKNFIRRTPNTLSGVDREKLEILSERVKELFKIEEEIDILMRDIVNNIKEE